MELLATLNYILERRCPSGGYCFYRLDEPNAEDTYYALKTLKLLGIDPGKDSKTVSFLKSLKDESIDILYYKSFSLEMLGESYRPSAGTLIVLEKALLSASSFVETAKFLLHAKRLLILFKLSDETPSDELLEIIGKMGIPRYLTEAYYLACSRSVLGLDLEMFRDFLLPCQRPQEGFVEAPDLGLRFLEQIYVGLKFCRLLDVRPLYPQACYDFVVSCRRKSGGFARSDLGIATIKHTYFAVFSVTYIKNNKLLTEVCHGG